MSQGQSNSWFNWGRLWSSPQAQAQAQAQAQSTQAQAAQSTQAQEQSTQAQSTQAQAAQFTPASASASTPVQFAQFTPAQTNPAPMDIDYEITAQMQGLSLVETKKEIRTLNDLHNAFFNIVPQSMVNISNVSRTVAQAITRTMFNSNYERSFLTMIDDYNRSNGRYVIQLRKETAEGYYDAQYLMSVVRRV